MPLSNVLIYTLAFAPFCICYVALAVACVRALKQGSGGMHPFAASMGQTCCAMCIVLVPFLMLMLMVQFGLAGSLVLGWGGLLWTIAAKLKEKKRPLLSVLAVLAGLAAILFWFSAILFSLPYPPVAVP